MVVAHIPGPMEKFKGEDVLYATGYQVKNNVIKQHFLIGFVLSLTIIGMLAGIPIILRGIYLRENPFKSIILTKTKLYEILNGKVIWADNISNIVGIRGRSTRMGFFELHIITHEGHDRYIKGNFYETELQILIQSLAAKLK